MMAEERGALLRHVASEHGVSLTVGEVVPGPTVTAYGLIPSGGTSPKRVAALVDSWSLAVGVPVRYVGPRGPYLIVEVPNDERTTVSLDAFMPASTGELLIPFGAGLRHHLFAELRTLPHLLIAGATGKGKSVYINALLVSLLRQADPDHLQLILVDPKRVELAAYAELPHLVAPVARSVAEARDALALAVATMEARYRDMEAAGAKTAAGLFPPLVVVVDELADLLLAGDSKSTEASLVRLAQLGRAASVHLIVATQYPTAKVLTPQIKQNIPTRIAFQTVNHVASNVIIGQSGAETLIGAGDALVMMNGSTQAERIQAPMVSDEAIEAIVAHWVAADELRRGLLEVTDLKPFIEQVNETVDQLASVTAIYSTVSPDVPSRVDTASAPSQEDIQRQLFLESAARAERAYAEGTEPLDVKVARLEAEVRRQGALLRQIDEFLRQSRQGPANIPTGGN